MEAFEMNKKIRIMIVVVLTICSLLNITVFASGTKKIVKDIISPIVKSTVPQNNQVEINVNSTISIVFSEEIVISKTFSKITLVDSGGNYISSKATISKNSINIKPNSSLDLNTKYSINLPVNCITDKSKNGLKKLFIFNFTTVKNNINKFTPINLYLDANYRPVKKLYFTKNENDPWMTESYTYVNGKKSSGIRICSGDIEDGIQRIMTYNSDGNLLDSTINFSPEEKQLAFKAHFKWSEDKGQNIFVPEKWEPKTPKPEEQRIYDNNGRIKERKFMFGARTIENNDLSVTYEFFPQDILYFTHDNNGNIEEARTWRDPGLFEASKEFIFKYKYDKYGNLTEQYDYYDGKLEDKIKYTYIYDHLGRIEEIVSYDLRGNSTVKVPFTEADEPKNLYSRTHFSYDKDSNLIESLRYGRQNELESRIVYKYE